jgi:hypothetical protein
VLVCNSVTKEVAGGIPAYTGPFQVLYECVYVYIVLDSICHVSYSVCLTYFHCRECLERCVIFLIYEMQGQLQHFILIPVSLI